MPEPDWPGYVARYHARHPGITETALDHARDPVVGTAHDWLVAGLPGRHGAVLDVACGSAPLHPRLRHDTYLGVDLSTSELAVARIRGRGPVGVADVRALPLRDRAVDTVVCALGLMLVHPVRDAVAEIARVLRPGGRLALLLPATWPVRVRDLRPLVTLSAALGGAGSMPQRLGPRSVRGLLGEAGFEAVSLERRGFPFPLEEGSHTRLAVDSLYTPGRDDARLTDAVRRLDALAGPGVRVGVPVMRVIAHRPAA